MDSNGDEKEHSLQQSNLDSDKYVELQKQYNELQNKFEKKKVIYNKINKGLKVISSYLNKKKKVEQEKKNKKKLKSNIKSNKTFQQPSNDYTEYNFSEADYETTNNNDTTSTNIDDKNISNQKNRAIEDNNLFDSSNIKVKFDQMSNTKNLNKIHNKKTNTIHKKHVKISSMNDFNTSQDINTDVFMTNENELMKLLDNEDMLNLKELDELNRLISDGYTLDDNVQNNESPDIGKYCESCNDFVISENENYTNSSADEDWDSSDSEDSLDISVSGMSGWSGLSGLSNNNKVGYYSDGYQSDDENGSERENDNLISAENTAFNDANYKNDKSNENLVLLKGRKSIQFDKKEEMNNQMKIHQHKVERGRRKSRNLNKGKTTDNDDFSMSDSSLPISRITTQNTTNSQVLSDNEMNNKDESISNKTSSNNMSSSVKPIKKEKGKRLRGSGKDDQYDAIKELHRKAIRMYKKRLIKKRQRMLEKVNEKGSQEQKKNTKLRPIKEVLGSDVVLDNIGKKPNLIVPNVNILPITHEQQQQQQIQQHAVLQSGMMPYNNMLLSNLSTLNNNVMQTPYKENQMFFNGGMPQMNPNKDNMYYNTPNMNLMLNNMNNNMSIDTPQIHTASPINDPNSLLNYKPQMNSIAVSPKFSNVRLASGIMPMGANMLGLKRPSIPSSNPSFNNYTNNIVETPSLDTTVATTIASPNESNNGGNMSKVIQQFANVYIQPGTLKAEEDKMTKTKKKYVKAVINIPDEFKDKDIITEEDLFNIFGLKISEKTKTAVDIWNQFHQVNELGHSFDKLNREFGTKWKMKCEAKFIKKYNRRHVMIKAVKSYMKLINTDDPYECLNKLDKYLTDENKPISYFFIRQHLPDWLQV